MTSLAAKSKPNQATDAPDRYEMPIYALLIQMGKLVLRPGGIEQPSKCWRCSI